MKTPLRSFRARRAGFTLVEMLTTVTIMVVVTAGALSVFLTGVRAMYKDMQRLATDSNLRNLTLQVARETIDASEFFVFPTYASLDGSVNLITDVSPLVLDSYSTQVAYGDCLVLVTRVTVSRLSQVRQFRIYYRVPRNAGNTPTPSNPNLTGEIRFYESTDYGEAGTATTLDALLNGVNLRSDPTFGGSKVLSRITRGRPITTAGSHWCPLTGGTCTHTTDYYPIFMTESSTTTATNESVSINVEVINGTTANNLLSSSSFNYTISPRR
jgi:prepilin-type N-terminal cleavage/methylation domain-containing protein